MNKSLVRCWTVKNYTPAGVDSLLISYPEDNAGHLLIVCTNCAKVYSASVAKMVYVGPPLEEALNKLNCLDCGRQLSATYAFYPMTYVARGKVHSFERPVEIPPAGASTIEEFDDVY